MRKFLRRFFLLLPIPLLVYSISIYVDPANIVRRNYEDGIVNYLVDGKNVTGIATHNYDDRLLQKLFISKMKMAPEVVALGSSKILSLSGDMVGTSSFINNAVVGATLEDYLGIYELYDSKRVKIKCVLIDLGPHLLNDNHRQIRWETLGPQVSDMLEKIGMPSGSKDEVVTRSEFSRFQELRHLGEQ